MISAKPPKIAERILREMKHGATALHGAGAYTGQERDVLMLAMTEMAHRLWKFWGAGSDHWAKPRTDACVRHVCVVAGRFS